MKNFAMGFAAVLVGVLTLTPGCGDDSDDDGTGGSTAGGSGGKGGSTSGGSSGKGGTSSGGSTSEGGETGDAGNTSAGGTPTEGGSTAGGAGGTPGAGGAGFMNPEGCPETAPATNDDCSVDLSIEETCQYAGSRCVCNGFMGGGGAGGAMAGNWICQGDGADCPDTAPATDDACDDNGLSCPYPGDINCFCAAGAWTCDDPAQGQAGAGNVPGDCPVEEPGDGDACSGGIYGCLYEDSGAVCSCPGAGPNEDAWDCQEP